MDELRELLSKFTSMKAAPSASRPPGDSSAEHVNVENEDQNGGEGEHSEGDKKNTSPKENPSSHGKGSKEEFHAVPPSYSPDPSIPHPHINNIGVPPKGSVGNKQAGKTCTSCVTILAKVEYKYIQL